jgi:hypothetical protein
MTDYIELPDESDFEREQDLDLDFNGFFGEEYDTPAAPPAKAPPPLVETEAKAVPKAVPEPTREPPREQTKETTKDPFEDDVDGERMFGTLPESMVPVPRVGKGLAAEGAKHSPGGKAASAFEPATRRLNVAKALTTVPPPRDFALPCLRIGTVGGLVSPGGAGKSMLAMQLALAVATGLDAIPGLFVRPGWQGLKAGGVFYASFEDGEEDAGGRLHSIWHSLGPEANRDALAAAEANLAVDTLTGVRPPDLLTEEWAGWLDEACRGRRLVVLDTLRMAHLSDENDAGAMSRLLAIMQGAAVRHRSSVLFLHHTSKAATMSGQGAAQQAARGSSVISDNARGQFYIQGLGEADARGDGPPLYDRAAPGPLAHIPLDGTDPEGRPMRLRYARFGVSKSNYSAPWPEVWLRRDERGVLSCANVGPASGGKQAAKASGKTGGRLA